MELTFYLAATVAIVATILVVTQYNLIHALLYLVVSFLAISVVFFVLGAPFMAALEIIIYAGAIVVLIIFVIMMLNLTREDVQHEKDWLQPRVWIGPAPVKRCSQMRSVTTRWFSVPWSEPKKAPRWLAVSDALARAPSSRSGSAASTTRSSPSWR